MSETVTTAVTDIITVPGVPFQPNAQQQQLLRWARDDQGSLNLVARAGTGKSTTLTLLVRYLVHLYHPQRIYPRIFMGAFNKAIAEELAAKMGPIPAVEVSTMHSLGFRLCKQVIQGKIEIDSRKVKGLVQKLAPWQPKKYKEVLADLVGYAKQAGFGVKGCPQLKDKQAWTNVADHFDLWDELPSDISPERFFNDAYKVYNQSLQLCTSEARIDFDDMILIPLLLGGDTKPEWFDWVLVDEAQDQSITRRLLSQLVLKTGGRMVAVGDNFQCQPPGTKVLLTGGKYKNIEHLVKGDELVTYDRKCATFVGVSIGGQKVLEKSVRHYSGRMLEIHSEQLGFKTQATPNHKFTVRWSDRSTDKNVVYLMRKGDYFRIGWCQLFDKSGCLHLGTRTRLEGADAAWIIEVHDTKQNASMAESLLSTEFQIPLPQFKQSVMSEVSHYTQEFLDSFWSDIAARVDLFNNAKRLLESRGRDILYPFYSGKNGRQGRTTVFVTQACNLMSGLMSIPSTTRNAEGFWYRLTVSESQYEGLVYSLDVDKNHNYVANGLLTNNSIYGFAGAAPNSMELIKEAMSAKELPLSVTYRCPKVVVEKAQQWVADIQAHESAPQGLITPMHHSDLWKQQFTSDDVILCRNTRPLVGIAQRLRKLGVPCVVEGNSGRTLIGLATKWGEVTIGELRKHLGDYLTEQKVKWTAKDRLDKLEAAEERVGQVRDMSAGMAESEPVRKLVQRIESLFGQSGEDTRDVLRLCTGHRAKGREWNRVFWIGPEYYHPSKWAKKEWEIQQEKNIEYVIVTRAKRELVEVEVELPEKGDDGELIEWWEF